MLVYKNNGIGYLDAGIGIGATAFTVVSGDGANFPSPIAGQFFYVRIGSDAVNEVIKVTSKTGDNFICEATGSAWYAGDMVICSVASEVFDEFLQIDYAAQTVAGFKIKSYSEILATPSSAAGVLNIDVENGNIVNIALTENITTINVSNIVTGAATNLILILTQDATGGWSVTWPASFKWAGGLAPTITATPNAIDVVVAFTVDNGVSWLASLAGANYS